MKKTLITAGLILIGFGPAHAQAEDAQIVAALAEISALENINSLCPNVYPDLAVLDSAEDRVYEFTVQKYGPERADDLLSSEQMNLEVRNAAYDVILKFEKRAGSPEKLCEFLESGQVKGVSKVPSELQEE